MKESIRQLLWRPTPAEGGVLGLVRKIGWLLRRRVKDLASLTAQEDA